MTTTKILVVDNYDSFVYTLVGYLQELGAETTVVRNDDVTLAEAIELAGTRDGVLISPGPGNPAEAGICIELIKWCGENSVPMFGVCLGHQALAEAFGGKVTHAPELMHGKTSQVEHIGTSVFAGLPSPVTATRYHSLAAVRESIPDVLEVTAQTASGVAVRRAVPSRIGPYRRRVPDARQLAGIAGHERRSGAGSETESPHPALAVSRTGRRPRRARKDVSPSWSASASASASAWVWPSESRFRWETAVAAAEPWPQRW
jgi:para-aminobenzoate synthetase component 2